MISMLYVILDVTLHLVFEMLSNFHDRASFTSFQALFIWSITSLSVEEVVRHADVREDSRKTNKGKKTNYHNNELLFRLRL